jgi:hypothetical protein
VSKEHVQTIASLALSSSCGSDGRPIRDEYLIVEGGKLAGTGARSYMVRETPKSLAGAIVAGGHRAR